MMAYPVPANECPIGVIGAGNIAMAIVSGLIHSGQVRADQISVSAPTAKNLTKFERMGCHTTHDNNQIFAHLVDNSKAKIGDKMLLICVKPNIFKSSKLFESEKLFETSGPYVVVSVMAGITIAQLRERYPPPGEDSIRYARLMPNTGAAICKGICGLAVESSLSADDSESLKKFLTSVLSLIGLCEFVTEQQINAVCGLGGSGIAFVYSLIHAMSDGGLKMGLPRSVSTNIAAQTVLGAAEMVLQTAKNPIVLRDEVTSPAGTTIHGLHALERGGFHALVMDAVGTATERANQLS